MFNLKALGNKIKDNISNKFEILLNKIAIKSKAYKTLYNEYNSFIITNKYTDRIDSVLQCTKIGQLIRFLLRDLPGSIGTLSGFDISVIRMSEPNDLLIVSDDFEKFRVLEEMKHFSGTGQVFTVEELTKKNQKINIPLGKVYVFSSVWLKDLVNLENLVYIIENEKESTKL